MTRHRWRLVAQALVLPLVVLTASFTGGYGTAGAAPPGHGNFKYKVAQGHFHVAAVKTGSGPVGGGRGPGFAPPGTIPGAFSGAPTQPN
jgi:hypothetical protein